MNNSTIKKINNNKKTNVKKNTKKKINTKNKNKKKIVNNQNIVKKKRFRIKYKNVLMFLLIVFFFIFLINFILNLKIKNVFIYNNTIFTDQEIMEMAQISNYPSNLKNPSSIIESRLLKNIYIKNVKVRKENFNQVHIDITENRPLFFNASLNKTVLISGATVEENFIVPNLINYIPDTIYNEFISQMANINISILKRVSEIKYDPNEVDDKRFLFTMNDENYVYLTLNKFNSINQYIDIIKNFENKKGILFLDSGEYFQVFDN